MKDRCIFGLIDPRSRRIYAVETARIDESVNDCVARIIAAARAGESTPSDDRTREILATGLQPAIVILQPEAEQTDRARWIATLNRAGNSILVARR